MPALSHGSGAAVIPGLSLHVDLGPHDFSSAALGLVLALLAAGHGFQVPVGGARSITHALLRRLEQHGGVVNWHARTFDRRGDGRAVAVRTDAGAEIPAAKAILADVVRPGPLLAIVARFVRSRLGAAIDTEISVWVGHLQNGLVLAGPVPWLAGEARQSAVVHAGDSIDDLSQFTNEARAGLLPSNPYLVIGQQSLLDATRAPLGCQTLWAYGGCRRSCRAAGQAQGSIADRIERRIEGRAGLSGVDSRPGDLRAGRSGADERKFGRRRSRRRRQCRFLAPAFLAPGLPLFSLSHAG